MSLRNSRKRVRLPAEGSVAPAFHSNTPSFESMLCRLGGEPDYKGR